MNCLYLTARFPYPPHRGDRLTAFHLLHSLARRHRVTLVSFTDGHEPPEAREQVARLCHSVETVPMHPARSWAQAWVGLASPLPSQVSYYRSAAMRRRIAALCARERFDAVFVQLFRMAPYVAEASSGARILFFADSLALALERSSRFQPWWRRPVVEWERRRVSAYEARISHQFDECWVLSDVDRLDLEQRGCVNVRVVTHGVDERLFELPIATPNARRVVFLGNLSVPHNVDAASYLAREIWPSVRRSVSGASLDLVGADPTPAVVALGALPGVRVTGPVADLASLWVETSVLVAPLRFSSGIQNKVLEAAAAGVPVVTTPQVAEALGADGREIMLVGADTGALSRATIDVLQNPERYRAMVERARSFVRARFTWDAMVARLEAAASNREMRR